MAKDATPRAKDERRLGGEEGELGAGCFTVAPSPGCWVSHGLCAIQLAHGQHRESGSPGPHR